MITLLFLWFKNYLSDRSHSVLLDSEESEALPVNFGFPQGSILGPLLFSLYISDFHTFIEKCNIHHYADDTQIFLDFFTSEYILASEAINNDLKSLLDISLAINLKLNANKSAVMYLGSKAKRKHFGPIER